MKKTLIVLIIILAVGSISIGALEIGENKPFTDSWQSVQRCVVSDPTGTPLNIRATPNGRVVGKLKNGAVVFVSTYSGDAQDRSWSQVKLTRKGAAKGWVLSEYLECD